MKKKRRADPKAKAPSRVTPAPTPEPPPPALGPWVNAVVTGVLLGAMQWSVFFLLQSYIASTAVVYLLATVVWLVGGLLGMVWPRGREAYWLGASIASFYLFRALATAYPYRLGWLPVLLALVAVMGAYGGRFFRRRAALFPKAKWLFFMENSGFVAGMLLTAAALLWLGEAWFTVGPLALLGAVVATGRELLSAADQPPSRPT
jgi:hypothetical protein